MAVNCASMPTVIELNNLSKVYKLYERPRDRLVEALSPWGQKRHKQFSALKNVSFSVNPGEVVGVIGKNGSGKSTLLKIITGVLSPTLGRAHVDGKIAALLELGAGFHPELTGLENIFLNGTMMGFSRAQMQNRLNDIVTFADIGDFIRQPVKTYSSGMFVRLAFATAINVNPDILIVDEALSVGDMFFQLKCYKKFEEFRTAGKTILFVTHDMGSILKYCNRAIVLNEGEKIGEGFPRDMVDLYKKVLVNAHTIKEDRNIVSTNRNLGNDRKPENLWKSQFNIDGQAQTYGNGNVNIIDFGLFNAEGELDSTLEKGKVWILKLRFEFNKEVVNPIFAFTLKDRKGTELTGTNTFFEGHEVSKVIAGEIVEVAFEQEMHLQSGQYFLSLGCTSINPFGELEVHQRMYDVLQFDVISHKNTVGIFDLNSKVSIIINSAEMDC